MSSEIDISIERAINRLNWIVEHELWYSDKLSKAAVDMAITALREKLAREQQPEGWIKCREQMPMGDCYVYEANSGRVLPAYHSEWEAAGWNVTHWHPFRLCGTCGKPMYQSGSWNDPFYQKWTCIGVERHKERAAFPLPAPPKEVRA